MAWFSCQKSIHVFLTKRNLDQSGQAFLILSLSVRTSAPKKRKDYHVRIGASARPAARVVQSQAEAVAVAGQQLEEVVAVLVVGEDRLAVVAAVHDVVSRRPRSTASGGADA